MFLLLMKYLQVIVPVTRCNSQKRETSSNFVLSMISADVTIMIGMVIVLVA